MSTPPPSPQQPQQPPEQPPPVAPTPTIPAMQPPAPQQPLPTAYPYPHPQSPVPQNPYAQPPSYGTAPLPAPPGAGGGSGRGGRAVLWAAVGALAASAAWAAGVFLTGGFGDRADLRGYSVPSNLCSGADYSSFKEKYPEDDTTSASSRSSLKSGALDESYCSIGLKESGSTYSDAYLTLQADLHKKTDPGPEFTAVWKNYGDSHTDYDVESVHGIGDEAYVVSYDTLSGSSTGSRYVSLAVRDGWLTYTMNYSTFGTSSSTAPQLDEVTDWMKADARSTLEKLKG
ncbi:hypothetical protein [Streptomyces sp. YIM S03343]